MRVWIVRSFPVFDVVSLRGIWKRRSLQRLILLNAALLALLLISAGESVHARSPAAAATGDDTNGDDETAIAKKIQNSLGDLCSIPFRNNLNFTYGQHQGTQDLLHGIWSFGGTPRLEGTGYISFLTQPFANYNFGRGWYAVSAPLITAGWPALRNNAWTVPIGGGGGKIVRIGGRLPVNISVAAYYNPVRPEFGSTW